MEHGDAVLLSTFRGRHLPSTLVHVNRHHVKIWIKIAENKDMNLLPPPPPLFFKLMFNSSSVETGSSVCVCTLWPHTCNRCTPLAWWSIWPPGSIWQRKHVQQRRQRPQSQTLCHGEAKQRSLMTPRPRVRACVTVKSSANEPHHVYVSQWESASWCVCLCVCVRLKLRFIIKNQSSAVSPITIAWG